MSDYDYNSGGDGDSESLLAFQRFAANIISLYTNSSSSNSTDVFEYDYDSGMDGDGGDDSDSLPALQRFVARALGYCVAFGSLMLYTPIIIRLLRQKHADGLVLSTWWLKLCSYTLSDIYYIRNHYELSTYAELISVSVETSIILGLVAVYQHHTQTKAFWVGLIALLVGAVYMFALAPEGLVATGQVWTVVIYSTAILPQFWHNYSTKTKGDYSPITAGLTVAGCLVRLFTVLTLNGGDPILLFSFFSSMLINGALLWQIVYYGTVVEGLTLAQVVLSDVVTANNNNRSEEVGNVTGGAYGGLYDGSDDGSDDDEPNPTTPTTQPILQQQQTASFRKRRLSNMELTDVVVQSPPSSTGSVMVDNSSGGLV